MVKPVEGHYLVCAGSRVKLLRPSNLVDDLRKLINNPAFADATFLEDLQTCNC